MNRKDSIVKWLSKGYNKFQKGCIREKHGQKRIQAMARKVGIGNQDFEKIRVNNNFYIDKTNFIREWWESGDEVTLITRPQIGRASCRERV